MRLVAVAFVALAAVAPLAGAAAPYTAIGTFLVGGAALPTDACQDSGFQGVSSVCVYVRSDVRGKIYHLTAGSATPISGVKACYYTLAKAQIGCQGGDPTDLTGTLGGTFPTSAAYVSVSAMTGTKVTWMLSTA